MKKILFTCALILAASLAMGQNIPGTLALKQLDGTEVLMKDVLKDDVVIVSFWATWCKPCQAELDALCDIEDMWKDKVRIVAISTDDSRAAAKVRSLVKGKRWPYEVLLDQNKELFKALNLTSIPFVMIVKNGETLYTHTGYTPGNERLVVEKALDYLKK